MANDGPPWPEILGGLFTVAAGGLIAWIIAIPTTDLVVWPVWPIALSALVTGYLWLASIFGWGLFHRVARPEVQAPSDPLINVTSHNQTGGITAGVINQVPEPKVSMRMVDDRVLEGEKYLTRFVIDIENPSAVSALTADIHATSLDSAALVPVTKVAMDASGWVKPGLYRKVLYNPVPPVNLNIACTTPEPLHVEIDYQ